MVDGTDAASTPRRLTCSSPAFAPVGGHRAVRASATVCCATVIRQPNTCPPWSATSGGLGAEPDRKDAGVEQTVLGVIPAAREGLPLGVGEVGDGAGLVFLQGLGNGEHGAEVVA